MVFIYHHIHILSLADSGCHLEHIWMNSLFSEVDCGDYIINSPMKGDKDSSMNSSHSSTRQSSTSSFSRPANIYLEQLY